MIGNACGDDLATRKMSLGRFIVLMRMRHPRDPIHICMAFDLDTKKITYSFILGNDIQHDKVHEVIWQWTYYINLTSKWVELHGDIRISFIEEKGHWSLLGVHCRQQQHDKPTANLQEIGRNIRQLRDSERATILHEFGHVIGFLHEHQSPFRGSIVILRVPARHAKYDKSILYST